MEPYAHLVLPKTHQALTGDSLHARFMGVSTLALEAQGDCLLIDGFFSRRPAHKVLLSRIGPDPDLIDAAIARGQLHDVRAVLVAHAHYDHAFDAPDVAQILKAQLVGSASVMQIADGRAIKVPHQVLRGERQAVAIPCLGPLPFKVTAIRSPHSPHGFFPGDNAAPPQAKAWFGCYRDGGNYSFLVERGDHRILVHPSAGADGANFEGVRAETVFLGIGALGKQDRAFFDRYWGKVVRQVAARRVIPVHWDNFFGPARALKPSPWPFDNVPKAMEWVIEQGAADGIEVALMPLFEPVDMPLFERKPLGATQSQPCCATVRDSPPPPNLWDRLTAGVGRHCPTAPSSDYYDLAR